MAAVFELRVEGPSSGLRKDWTYKRVRIILARQGENDIIDERDITVTRRMDFPKRSLCNNSSNNNNILAGTNRFPF